MYIYIYIYTHTYIYIYTYNFTQMKNICSRNIKHVHTLLCIAIGAPLDGGPRPLREVGPEAARRAERQRGAPRGEYYSILYYTIYQTILD